MNYPLPLVSCLNYPLLLVSGMNYPLLLVSGRNYPLLLDSGTNYPLPLVSGTNYPLLLVSGTNYPIPLVSGMKYPLWFAPPRQGGRQSQNCTLSFLFTLVFLPLLLFFYKYFSSDLSFLSVQIEYFIEFRVVYFCHRFPIVNTVH